MFQKTIIFSILLWLSAPAASHPETKLKQEKLKQPNILLIVAEDLSPRIGAYGDEIAQTPNLDALAVQGMRFTNVFSAAGVCAPNRSALISGMHPISLGTHQMRTDSMPLPNGNKGYETVPPKEMKAFPELLRKAGYVTANFAKKDYQFGDPSTIWDYHAGGYLSALDTAIWEKLPPDKPFFAMINLMSTHEGHLMDSEAKPQGKFAEFFKAIQKHQNKTVKKITDPADVIVPPYYPDTAKVRKSLAQHYDNIHYMDAEVGAILVELKAAQLEENTIVIWTTDHGDALPRAKRSVYDSGLKIPLIIKFPNHKVAGNVNSKLISMVDFAPTILNLAGIDTPDFIQGKSIFSNQKRDYVYASRDRMDLVPDKQRAIRNKQFKYIRNDMPELAYFRPLEFRDSFPVMQSLWQGLKDHELNATQAFYFQSPRPNEELYDVINDPWEINNLSADPNYKKQLTTMRNALDNWLLQANDHSSQPELAMIAKMWPTYQQPTTTTPKAELVNCNNSKCLKLSNSEENPSISYRYVNNGVADVWQIYTQPIPLNSSLKIDIKAIRYGYKESTVEQYNYEQK